MVLSDSTLKKRFYQLFDFEKSNIDKDKIYSHINPNSIDLTLDNYCLYMKPYEIITYGENTQEFWISKNYISDYLIINPNECVLCCSKEYIKMPNDLCGQLFTKSTLGRTFVNHMMAGVVDAGFEGKITLELKNDSPNIIKIPFGSRIVQLIYSKLDMEAEIPYSIRNSRYNGANICEPPKEERTYG